MTQDYYGTKRVTAWPETRGGRTSSQSPVQQGYAVKYEDGYTSWSPKDVFEKAYRPITAMGFGHAIVALKAGERVARQGWNGKGMFLWLQKGSAEELADDRDAGLINGVGSEHFELGDHNTETRMPCICMRAADRSTVTGWLASQTDLLAEDWMIVE